MYQVDDEVTPMSGPHDNDRCSGCGAVGDEQHETYCRFGKPPLHAWLLERIRDRHADEWDVTNAVVVQAVSEADARKLASAKHGQEGRDAWLDPTLVRCQKLPLEEGVARVLVYEHAT